MRKFTKEEALSESIAYFRGDELAATTWINKYTLKDIEGNLLESNPDMMHRRIAKEFARIEANYPNPISEEEIYVRLNNFEKIVPQGSPMFGIGNNHSVVSLSNCFVIGSDKYDSYGAIMRIDEQIVQLSKRRGGVGTDLSHIRPSGSRVKNSAQTSTGIVPFMERYSNTTREVGQDGRRAALMLSIDIKHPESENFIDTKLENGKVTGANISIKIGDAFMNAVENNEQFKFQYPIDSLNPLMVIEKSASKLWKKIVYNAWKSAEPGILFWDQIIRESPADCYAEHGFKTISTNPCVIGTTLMPIKEIIEDIEPMKIENDWNWYCIEDLVGKTVTTWNGYEESIVAPRITGKNEPIIKFNFSNGLELNTTYYHKFIIEKDGNSIRINAGELVVGDIITKYLDLNNNTITGVSITSIEKLTDLADFVYCFTDNKNNSTMFNGILSGNCGEIPLCDKDSCRLLLLNLLGYVVNPFTSKAYFDFKSFREDARIAQRLMDDLLDLEIEKLDEIINKIKNDPESDDIKSVELNLWSGIREMAIKGRRTGLGITAEGDMLASLGFRYGTDEATVFATEVQKTLAIEAYKSSIEMAEERGSFPVWNYDNEKENPFINRLINANYDGIGIDVEKYKKVGRRNISLLTIPPAGTTSIMTQTTSGIEPVFMPIYKRRRKTMDKSKSSFVDINGDMWEEFIVFHDKFIMWYEIYCSENDIECKSIETLNEEEIKFYYEKSPYYLATANDVDWVKKVEMQGSLQQFIDHSTSTTVNVPKETDVETINAIYLTAYKSGCKGITVYRDGSRSGVLISKDEKKTDSNNEITYHDAPKRPKVLNVDIHTKIAKGKHWTVLVGLFNAKPYETFAFEQLPNHDFPHDITKGTLTRIGKQQYTLKATKGDKEYKIENIILLLSGDEQTQTRSFSRELRHGINPKFIVSDIGKDALVTSFKAVIARTLKLYISDNEKAGSCPKCGDELRYEGGCVTCPSCGEGKCG